MRYRVAHTSVALAAAGLLGWMGFTGAAWAVAPRPPFPTLENYPKRLPANGVLAIGIQSSSAPAASTTSLAPVLLRDAKQMEHTGKLVTQEVPLGNGQQQRITTFAPDVELAEGPAEVTFQDTLGGSQVTPFEVAPRSNVEELVLSLQDSKLETAAGAEQNLACGERKDSRGGVYPTTIPLAYSRVPAASFNLKVSGTPEAVSQFFFRTQRATDPVASYQFAAIGNLTDQVTRIVGLQFQPAEEYCVRIQAVSLKTGQLKTYEPFCVADSGADWTQKDGATSEQVDAALLSCVLPPEVLLPRYCALRTAAPMPGDVCEKYTQAQLAAAKAMPVDGAALAALVGGSVNPTSSASSVPLSPTATSVTPGTGTTTAVRAIPGTALVPPSVASSGPLAMSSSSVSSRDARPDMPPAPTGAQAGPRATASVSAGDDDVATGPQNDGCGVASHGGRRPEVPGTVGSMMLLGFVLALGRRRLGLGKSL